MKTQITLTLPDGVTPADLESLLDSMTAYVLKTSGSKLSINNGYECRHLPNHDGRILPITEVGNKVVSHPEIPTPMLSKALNQAETPQSIVGGVPKLEWDENFAKVKTNNGEILLYVDYKEFFVFRNKDGDILCEQKAKNSKAECQAHFEANYEAIMDGTYGKEATNE